MNPRPLAFVALTLIGALAADPISDGQQAPAPRTPAAATPDTGPKSGPAKSRNGGKIVGGGGVARPGPVLGAVADAPPAIEPLAASAVPAAGAPAAAILLAEADTAPIDVPEDPDADRRPVPGGFGFGGASGGGGSGGGGTGGGAGGGSGGTSGTGGPTSTTGGTTGGTAPTGTGPTATAPTGTAPTGGPGGGTQFAELSGGLPDIPRRDLEIDTGGPGAPPASIFPEPEAPGGQPPPGGAPGHPGGGGPAAQIPASPVPEPAQWALMLLGFGLIGATLRARRPRRV